MLWVKKTGRTKSPVSIISAIVLFICVISLLAVIRFTFPEKWDYMLEIVHRNAPVSSLDGKYKLNSEKAWTYNKKAHCR